MTLISSFYLTMSQSIRLARSVRQAAMASELLQQRVGIPAANDHLGQSADHDGGHA